MRRLCCLVVCLMGCKGELGDTRADGAPPGGDSNSTGDSSAGDTPGDPTPGDPTPGDPGVPADCADADVLCVDDTAGATQEYTTIQAAADAVAAGQTILVHEGRYAGFRLETTGTPSARVVVRGVGDAVIDSDGPSGYGVFLNNVSYVTVEDMEVVGVSARGFAHRGATATSPVVGLVLRNNVITDAGAEGMYVSQVSDSLIEGNVITNAGTSGADRTHGIYLSNAGSDGTTLRGNIISESGTAGIHFNGDLSIGGDGIISDLLVEANVLFNNGQNGLNMDGVQDSIIRNNLIYGNASNGIRAYAIDGAEGPRGLVIVNNTFHVPNGAGWCVRITEDEALNVVFNNILMNDGGNGSIALDNTVAFASANNAVVDTFTPDRDNTILSLAEWQVLGYDADSFVATPAQLFVGAGDYRLQPGCNAEDAGVTNFSGETSPSTDLDGGARDSSPDMGAFENP